MSFLKTQNFRFRIVSNRNYIIHSLTQFYSHNQKETNINYKYRIMWQTAPSSLKSDLLNTFPIIHLREIYSEYGEYEALQGHCDLGKMHAFL